MRRLFRWLQLQRVVYMLAVAALVLTLGSDNTAWAGDFGSAPAKVVFFGEPLAGNLQAVLFQNRAYIPADALNQLDVQVEWDEKTCTLLINSSASDCPSERGPLYLGYQTVHMVISQQLITGTSPALLQNGTVWVPLRVLSELGLQIGWDRLTATAFAGTLDPHTLPTVGSLTNLQKLVQGHAQMFMYKTLEGAVNDTANAAEPRAGAEQGATPSHSGTNVQVAGVDESDIVKTDGNFIYQVRGQTVSIIRAWPVAEAGLIANISFEDQEFSPLELYINGNQLVIIGQTSGGPLRERMMALPAGANPDAGRSMPWFGYWNPLTKAIVYDTSDKQKPTLIREVELEGSYLSSRKIGDQLYLLANKDLLYYEVMQPFYRDSAAGDNFSGVPYEDIKYFPGPCQPSYLMVAGLDLGTPDKAACIDAYLGAGNNVYMSRDNLYVALTRWYDATTDVYRFTVSGPKLKYASKGEVPGHILNQFSMDEFDRHFRVATTSRDKQGQTINNVYVLDSGLKISGKLEDIAPGERIYSARFVGEKGYLVTFEQVDPLFVLDLAKPAQPKILGALKIPGFSTYLHPLDDKHILGLGRDTQVIQQKDEQGKVVGNPLVLQQGIKLAIFDVSDVSNPKELHAITLGGRGSHAEALYNHKALLFDQQSGLLAFAASLTADSSDPWEYGAVQFQGALFLEVDLENGIVQRGRVTHLSDDEYQKLGYYWGGSADEVRRVLRIDENLYVISSSQITIHDQSLNTVRVLTLK